MLFNKKFLQPFVNENGGYSASLIADYIIANSKEAATSIQVIKTAYIAHGYSLAALNKPLVKENAQAWRYGPVFPSMYFALRDHEQRPIQSLEYCGTARNGPEIGARRKFLSNQIDAKRRGILDATIEMYGHLSGSRLISITHAKDTPWKKYYKPGTFHTVIPNEATRQYYKKKLGMERA